MILPELNKLIELYEKNLSNLQWHLDNNSEMLGDGELVRQRISDKHSVIYDLNNLYKKGLEVFENA